MYLLDTNVISELRRGDRAAESVVSWIRGTNALDHHISVITVLELELGALLKARRDPSQGALLLDWINRQVMVTFHDKILPIDVVVARRCARMHVPDPRPERDALIAATALTHGMIVVTRNTKDFVQLDVPIIDPWD